jgi:hypothetical protein
MDDPESQYLAQTLQALGKAPVRSGAELGENLLAEALLRYAYRRQLAANQPFDPNAPTEMRGYLPAASLPDTSAAPGH